MEQKIKNKWYKRWWMIILYIFIGFILIGLLFGKKNPAPLESSLNDISEKKAQSTVSPIVVQSTSEKIIKTPDTKRFLFSLNGTEIVEGNCLSAKSFTEYHIALPKYCESITSTNIANYCELGNKKGENINYYYCRPMRYIKCKLISFSGEIEDVKYYGITKVLKCDNKIEQLIDVQIKSCTTDGFDWSCS